MLVVIVAEGKESGQGTGFWNRLGNRIESIYLTCAIRRSYLLRSGIAAFCWKISILQGFFSKPTGKLSPQETE